MKTNEIRLEVNGPFYKKLNDQENYSAEHKACIEETTVALLEHETNANKPGMLLGNVQSGKTRTFLGIIALAFDNDYEIAIILTKGTKALARQTYRRVRDTFRYFIEESDDHQMQVYDIMQVPRDLTRNQLSKKLIFIVKKEDDNMNRLASYFFEIYPNLGQRQILIVDDEADLASIGFTNSREFGLQMNKIAKQISDFRSVLNRDCDLLQVTATPYSLYLQPEDLVVQGEVFMPIRPAFTKLVPIHQSYIGSKQYFEDSQDPESIYFYLWEEVPEQEMEVLSNQHGSYLNNILSSPKLQMLRNAFSIFLVGGCIRRLQNKRNSKRPGKYSFIIHTDTAKSKHSWQFNLITRLKEVLEEAAINNGDILEPLIFSAYENLQVSANQVDAYFPTFNEVIDEVKKALREEYLGIIRVNSDSDITTLLDDNGQLFLDNPLTIFIGGQILDRGITIDNLIGFFYGRNPSKFQLDTVLQHSRMYGSRPIEDMVVTRFYTTKRIYEAMLRMHDIDSTLRSSFENNSFDKGVIFIQGDSNHTIRPCSPNKILLSETVTIQRSTRLLPKDFTTTKSAVAQECTRKIDEYLVGKIGTLDIKDPFVFSVSELIPIILSIEESLEFETPDSWSWNSFIATVSYLCKMTSDNEMIDKINVILRINRDVNRWVGSNKDKPNRKPESTEDDSEGDIAQKRSINSPTLILLRQNGSEKNGWKGSSFYWPVLYAPRNMKPIIYSSEA